MTVHLALSIWPLNISGEALSAFFSARRVFGSSAGRRQNVPGLSAKCQVLPPKYMSFGTLEYRR